MTDSKALIERLRADWPEILVEKHWMMDSDAIEEQRREAADHIEKLEADNARLNDALRQAVMDAAEWARKAGEAQGKLEISEAAGVLDGWKRDCEQLRADNARLREALEPFARAQHIVASVDGERIRCVLTYPPEAKQTFTLTSLNEARAALQGTSHDA